MGKPRKSPNQKNVGEQFCFDSDKLQLLDEIDSEWSEAWKTAAEQLTVEVQVSEHNEHKRRLVRIKKHR